MCKETRCMFAPIPALQSNHYIEWIWPDYLKESKPGNLKFFLKMGTLKIQIQTLVIPTGVEKAIHFKFNMSLSQNRLRKLGQ